MQDANLTLPSPPDRADAIRFEPALDGLRALAVVAVVVVHTKPNWLPGGWAGVDVFFVLSGYLITRLLARELARTRRLNLRRFYIRRLLRLAPAFLVLLAEEIVRVSFFSGHRDQNLQGIAMAAAYLMNWNIAFNWLPQGALGHTWSLAMEEQFYIVWPLVLLLVFFKRPLVWISCGIVGIFLWRMYLVQHGADPDRTYMGFDTHADALLIGCGLALAPLGFRTYDLARRFSLIPLALLLLIMLSFQHRTSLSQGVGLTLAALASAWLVAAAITPGRLQWMLSRKPLTYTGRLSYSWYLWHYPILVVLRPHIPESLVLGLVPLGYLAAVASYHVVEKPVLKYKDRLDSDGQRASWAGARALFLRRSFSAGTGLGV